VKTTTTEPAIIYRSPKGIVVAYNHVGIKLFCYSPGLFAHVFWEKYKSVIFSYDDAEWVDTNVKPD